MDRYGVAMGGSGGGRECSLKYDREMVRKLEADGDLRMFLKDNDEHGYLYVGDNDGPKRRTQKAMWSCDHGVVCGSRSEKLSASDREAHPRNLEMAQTSFEIMVYAWVCASTGLSAVTPPPPLTGRSPHSFTDKRRDVNRGKPFSVTGKPMRN
ncbi:hypothetical protein Cgig2_004084 [Carnegiea gigantea]|uniref:Uncharacterized protein n=1 Tax=Carnegiea gigantea TaxID=171969 RepID=A0A9Q1KSR7_9CARY|nr:hypothetical protein Cgig2_004084 [Carnegiea gigantea]